MPILVQFPANAKPTAIATATQLIGKYNSTPEWGVPVPIPSESFTQALKGADRSALSAKRDQLVAAWKGLRGDHQLKRERDLLGQLDKYEMQVNHRRPSEDALRDQYGLR